MNNLQKKVVAFVPAKGTSSRVENKNTKLLDGKPLFLHAIEKLMSCPFIDEVYLDTESDHLIGLASSSGCKVLRRDPALANNKTDGNKLFMNEVRQVEADIYIQLLSTSPFIKKGTIEQAINVVAGGDHDSAVLVRKDKLYTWSETGPVYDINNIPNSIDLPETTIETMGLYVMSKAAAFETERRIGEKPAQIEAGVLEAVDVNWPEEFELANFIASGMREAERKLYNNIKANLTSSALSDILTDLGINSVVTGYAPNLRNSKVFGRSKTLRLRKRRDNEPIDGIYEALKSYKTIVPGDVIVVENELSDFAYFGELNANLAIRSGAAGAIIGGVTRDSVEVEKLGFPVFSKGYSCKDVRGKAVLDHYNHPINFEGVKVQAGDLVFGDRDGIVCIPQKSEKEVMTKVFEVLSTENKILQDIAKGIDEEQLVNSHGAF